MTEVVQTYTQALDAKLANKRFLDTIEAERCITVAMEQITGPNHPDLPTIVLFWRGVGKYVNEIATPYFFSGDVCQLIAAGATALDKDYRLQAEDLPGPAGHFHYAQTFQTEQNETEHGTITTRLIGVSWATYGFGLTNVSTPGKGPAEPVVNHPKTTIVDNVGMAPDKAQGIVIVTWSLADEMKLRPYGLPLSMHCWVFGDTAAEVYDAQDALSENLAMIRDKITHNQDYTECTLIAASMLFMQQTIIQVSEGDIPRTIIKQAERDKRSRELVRPIIVHLRRRKTVKGDDDEAHSDEAHLENKKRVEWSHRWPVEGHWRNQPYKSLGVIKRIWIHSQIRGPEDKPLRVKRVKIAAVVR